MADATAPAHAGAVVLPSSECKTTMTRATRDALRMMVVGLLLAGFAVLGIA